KIEEVVRLRWVGRRVAAGSVRADRRSTATFVFARSSPRRASTMPIALPVIESCEGCGACCRVVTLPPFRRDFDEGGEDAWERLRWGRPAPFARFIAADPLL